jgi:predicted secreted protein
MSNARIGYNLTLEVGNAPGTSPTYTELAEVTGFTPPAGAVDEVEVTHLKSASRRRQFIAGLIDSGTVTATFNHVPASATDTFINTWRAGAEQRQVRATYPDGTTVIFTAFVSDYSIDNIVVDGKMASSMTVKVTGAVTVSGAATPVNDVLPAIGGIARVGVTLTAFPGNWTGGPTFTYQWQEDTAGNGTWVNISGATAQTFTPTSGQLTDRIRVQVTGTNSAGNATASSAPTIATVAA